MLALYIEYTCMYCFDPQTRRIVACGYMHAYHTVYCMLAACPGTQCALHACAYSYEYSVCVTLPGLVVVGRCTWGFVHITQCWGFCDKWQ